MVRYKLVQRVRVRRSVPNKALVIILMVPSKLHFRIEREMISMLFKRLHVVAECIVHSTSLRQYVCEQTIAHANTEESFDLSFGRYRTIITETLKRRQKKYAASGFQHFATFHDNTRNLLLVGGHLSPLWKGEQGENGHQP